MPDVTALLRSAGFAGDGVDLRIVGGPSALRGVTLQRLITDPAALGEAVEDYADLQQQHFGPSAARHVAALWLLQDVAWIHAVLAVGLIEAHSISLRPDSAALAMELPRDMFFGVELAIESVSTHTAAAPAARTQLYRDSRRYLAELLAPLQQPISWHLKAGPRAFWACVTDMATGAICTGASSSRTSALASFDGAGGPLLSGERLVSSPAGPIRRRHGCCLLYTIEGMSLCFSCPRIPIA